MDKPYRIVLPKAGMFDAWYALYARYGGDVGDLVDERIGRTVWQWLLSGTHRVAGLLAVHDADGVVGFAHYRPFPRTLDGNEACYLDDLYVVESHRGAGVGRRLIERVCAIAQAKGWTEVRWVTGKDNARAQVLYDRIAERSDLITYRVLKLSNAPIQPS